MSTSVTVFDAAVAGLQFTRPRSLVAPYGGARPVRADAELWFCYHLRSSQAIAGTTLLDDADVLHVQHRACADGPSPCPPQRKSHDTWALIRNKHFSNDYDTQMAMGISSFNEVFFRHHKFTIANNLKN